MIVLEQILDPKKFSELTKEEGDAAGISRPARTARFRVMSTCTVVRETTRAAECSAVRRVQRSRDRHEDMAAPVVPPRAFNPNQLCEMWIDYSRRGRTI